MRMTTVKIFSIKLFTLEYNKQHDINYFHGAYWSLKLKINSWNLKIFHFIFIQEEYILVML